MVVYFQLIWSAKILDGSNSRFQKYFEPFLRKFNYKFSKFDNMTIIFHFRKVRWQFRKNYYDKFSWNIFSEEYKHLKWNKCPIILPHGVNQSAWWVQLKCIQGSKKSGTLRGYKRNALKETHFNVSGTVVAQACVNGKMSPHFFGIYKKQIKFLILHTF